MQNILVTGALGLIGRHVIQALLNREETYQIHVLVRPGKKLPASWIQQNIQPIYVDLADLNAVKTTIKDYTFDTIFHIGAVRGGRDFPKEIYRKVNIEATQILAEFALQHDARFIFCSSVGVFGAIPRELPPTESTMRKNDNYYHTTKIEAEKILLALQVKGLHYHILRPAITYGADDFGFPYTLIHLVRKGLFLNTTQPVKIHLLDVETAAQAFVQAALLDLPNGSVFNLADAQPIELKILVDFISQKLYQRAYPRWKTLPDFLFRLGEFFFGKILHNELWKARFELISQSWYYHSQPVENELKVPLKQTIPNFTSLIDWYKLFETEDR